MDVNESALLQYGGNLDFFKSKVQQNFKNSDYFRLDSNRLFSLNRFKREASISFSLHKI